ncbi:YeeE/YedE family protein [Halovulum dunhuangense]
MDLITDGQLTALIGLAGGVVLGLAARLGRFCTLGAIEDWLYGSDDRRMRMWLVAIGVAMIGSFALMGLGRLDPREAIFLMPAWNPIASIVGGAMFGYGMALAGNCGYGALARAGGGDMRSFVILLVMAVSAYMAIAGPTGMLRVWLFPQELAAEVPGLAHLASRATGLSPTLFGVVAGALLLALALSSARFRADWRKLAWAVAVGLAIVSGWAGTQWISSTGFEPVRVTTHSFSGPLGETLIYAMTTSGAALNFGIGSVVGVATGAFLGSLMKRQFRWEACEDPRELRRQMIGAFLMGTGGVTAVGCSIGQGLSAFSLLAYSAPVTFAAIIAGAALGLRQLIWGAHGNELSA